MKIKTFHNYLQFYKAVIFLLISNIIAVIVAILFETPLPLLLNIGLNICLILLRYNQNKKVNIRKKAEQWIKDNHIKDYHIIEHENIFKTVTVFVKENEDESTYHAILNMFNYKYGTHICGK